MLKTGDKVWFIPGYSGNHLLVVECEIIEIDDDFYKKDPNAYIFYWLDEPIGHSVDEEELFSSLEDAKNYLLEIEHELTDPLLNANLNDYRKDRIHFVVSTWEDLSLEEQAEEREYWLNRLTYKQHLTQWFNLKDLHEERLEFRG